MNGTGRAPPQWGLPSSTAKPIVFVVDDDVSVRESLELLIDCAGWQPKLCASTEEFLRLPRVQSPSCLLLDVSLPNINGLDLQKLVADRLEMPIIFITGCGDVRDGTGHEGGGRRVPDQTIRR
jgi:FixJ family two-component response regulator